MQLQQAIWFLVCLSKDWHLYQFYSAKLCRRFPVWKSWKCCPADKNSNSWHKNMRPSYVPSLLQVVAWVMSSLLGFFIIPVLFRGCEKNICSAAPLSSGAHNFGNDSVTYRIQHSIFISGKRTQLWVLGSQCIVVIGRLRYKDRMEEKDDTGINIM